MNFYLTTRIHYAMLQGTSVCPDLQSPSGLQNRNMAESITQSSLSQEATQSESSGAYRVHLSEHCTLPKKHWLSGIHQNKVKVGLPGLMGCTCL